ncbi:MAG: hypothetical protein WC455_22515 [Dehalococcoidia bacterium]|jgi:hypothetical protein
MKPRLNLKIKLCDRSVVEVLTTPIMLDVPGFSEPVAAAVDKRDRWWCVSDIQTGTLIAHGDTRKVAIAEAKARLEREGEARYFAAVERLGAPKARTFIRGQQ